MSLVNRKKRPLIRDPGRFRDDRLFIIACDDTYAPKQYFGFFSIPRIQVHVVSSEEGRNSAAHVLERLLAINHEEDDELWMLLDADHYTRGRHVPGFVDAIRTANQNGVKIALSKPCFEIWLLLHHLQETSVRQLEKAVDVERVLREILGEYNKRNLKKEHYPLASVQDACVRAERLDGPVSQEVIPASNTSRIYLLWKAIVSKALPSQLPDELRRLFEGI